MDDKELRELRKQVKELRKSQAKVTVASVEELKREIMRHTAGEKAMEAQKKRMEALEKARAVRASVAEKKPLGAVAEEKRVVKKPLGAVAAEKRVEKPKPKAEKPKEEPVLAKNVRRKVVKDGGDE